MLNPGASARESSGEQPGDLTMRQAADETIPDLSAGGLTAEQDGVADDSSAAASEVVVEYIEE